MKIAGFEFQRDDEGTGGVCFVGIRVEDTAHGLSLIYGLSQTPIAELLAKGGSKGKAEVEPLALTPTAGEPKPAKPAKAPAKKDPVAEAAAAEGKAKGAPAVAAKEAIAAVPLKEAAPAADIPAALVTASNFRQVMNWMIDPAGGNTRDAEVIAAKCEAWKAGIPALGRLSGNVLDRVQRALEVLAGEQAAG